MLLPADQHYIGTLVPPPPGFKGMGALPLHPDPRDWFVRDDPVIQQFLPSGPKAAPASATLLPFVTGPAYDQGMTGACVAASSCGVCSTDEQQFANNWTVFNWRQLYTEAGGTGSNGVDTRLVLKICTEQGTPLATGGRKQVIASYDFLTQSPGSFREEAKACIAAGFPITVALLLPSDFGWMSGQPNAGVTTGYHQVAGIGYDVDYLVILNSWGQGWTGNAAAPRPGVGSIRWDYLEASNCQNRYMYGYRTTAKTGGGPTPTPKPPIVSGYQPNPVKSASPFSIQGQNFDQGGLSVSFAGQSLPIQGTAPDAIATTAPAVQTTTAAPVTVAAGGQQTTGPSLTVTVDQPPPPTPKTKANITGVVTGSDVSSLAPGQQYSLGGGMTLVLSTVDFADPGPGPGPGPGPDPGPGPGPGPDPGPGGIQVLLSTKPSQLRNTVSVIAYTADPQGGSLPASVNGEVVGPQGTVQLQGQTTHGTQSPAIWNIQRPAPWGTPCVCTVRAYGSGKSGEATKPG